MDRSVPFIKICGLTDPAEAAECARLGADAVGLVFFPPSPRHVKMDLAAEIAAALPAHVVPAGVFVDPHWDLLTEAVACCRIGVVQLHGSESPDFVARVRRELDVAVWKGLFATRSPMMADAGNYQPDAFLVECGKGALPGGNAMVWDWGAAAGFAHTYPTVLAGGLDPDNVARAIRAARPDAVDASSGLEAGPGHKDLDKVKRYIDAVQQTAPYYDKEERRPRPLLKGA
jgi:phosphoribosylanthranilate isomerase